MTIEPTVLKSTILTTSKARPAAEAPASFGDVLRSALDEVNRLQIEADRSTAQLALGTAENLHQVMIAGERALLALQLTIAVRNKVIEAYQELSRMQI